jgi:hypothetical protein
MIEEVAEQGAGDWIFGTILVDGGDLRGRVPNFPGAALSGGCRVGWPGGWPGDLPTRNTRTAASQSGNQVLDPQVLTPSQSPTYFKRLTDDTLATPQAFYTARKRLWESEDLRQHFSKFFVILQLFSFWDFLGHHILDMIGNES